MSALPFPLLQQGNRSWFFLDPSLFGLNGKELSSMEPGLTVNWEDGFFLAMSVTKTGKTYLRLRK